MIGTIEVDAKGNPINATVSSYMPSEEIKKLTEKIQQDYQIGYNILHTSYKEFGASDLTPLSVADRDQKLFNSYEESEIGDPDEDWKWRGVRPVTRNKIIGTAAHFLSALLYPSAFAQNKDDEEDKDAANLIQDMIKWNILNSDYPITFLFGIIAALVNPVAYLKAEFFEVMQSIKEKADNGKITRTEVIDEVLSGLKILNVPMDEILFGNAYEYNIQKQRFLIRRRFIDIDEAQALYKDVEDFKKYVRVGIKCLYDSGSGQFFNMVDEDSPTLLEEVVYMNRREDLEVAYLNGIFVSKKDIESNLVKHRDYKNRPKYPYVKFGYSPIDEKRFYFYKSAVNELAPNQKLTDKIWQMVVNGTYLSVEPPIWTKGSQVVNSSILYPSAVVHFKDPLSEVTPISLGQNLRAGYDALAIIDSSMGDTSKIANLPAKPGATAYEISQTIQEARIQLGLFGQMIGQAVVDLGYLMVDLILLHQTVADVQEITDSGKSILKYNNYLLPSQIEQGKTVTKHIKFTNQELEGGLEASMKLLNEEGGMDSDKRIYLVNPEKFRNLRFLLTIQPDQLLPKNEMFEKALNLEAYDRMVNNPYIDQQPITRDFLVETFARGKSDKYMIKQAPQMNPAMTGVTSGNKRSSQATAPGSLVGQMTGQGPLASLLKG